MKASQHWILGMNENDFYNEHIKLMEISITEINKEIKSLTKNLSIKTNGSEGQRKAWRQLQYTRKKQVKRLTLELDLMKK